MSDLNQNSCNHVLKNLENPNDHLAIEVDVTEKESIAEGFDKFFSVARTKLADKIRGQKARSGAPYEHTFSVSSGLTQKQFRKLFNTFKQGFCEK